MRNSSENQITLVLIRHGKTKSNAQHRYLGKTDEMLSKEGIQELLQNKKMQCYPDVDIVFASPMKRCVQTAQILYPYVPYATVDEWTEMDFGDFEGKNYQELQGDERYQEWIDSNGTLPFPRGESREDFIERCEKGFWKMQTQAMKAEKVGMIVHGGTIMAILSRYGGGEYFDYRTDNGKGYVCTVKNFNKKPEITEIKKI
ncbi:MAG: histidine phosphatase family protein [Clostridia bacterium]|nr:histidine phosphatase family protein [Clostridia bacterium]